MIHNDTGSLDPRFKALAEAAISAQITALKKFNLFLIILETRRELVTQLAYYARGRMDPLDVQAIYKACGLYALSIGEAGSKVTWTLDSKHLKGLAYDAVPSRDGVHPWWDAPSEVWEALYVAAESRGLEAGGRWKNKDAPHFQFKG